MPGEGLWALRGSILWLFWLFSFPEDPFLSEIDGYIMDLLLKTLWI